MGNSRNSQSFINNQNIKTMAVKKVAKKVAKKVITKKVAKKAVKNTK